MLVITLIFLAPIYWIASTAFKPLTDDASNVSAYSPSPKHPDLSSPSEDSLRRNHHDKICKIGPRRLAMRSTSWTSA